MFRLALIPVGLAIGYFAMNMRRDHVSEDERKVSHRLVATIDGYATGKDYYDQLVDDAHDQCFEQCYHMEGTGRHDPSWLDRTEYRHELFKLMIQQAKDDKATGVAMALEKYRVEHIDVQGAAPAVPASRPVGRR